MKIPCLLAAAICMLFASLAGSASAQIVGEPPAALLGVTGGSISIAASVSLATSCQWQKSTDGGSSYANIVGNPSARTATLNLIDLRESDSAVYRLTTPSGNSTAAVLHVVATAEVTPTPPINFAFIAPGSSGVAVAGPAAIGGATSIWNNLTGADLSSTQASQNLLDDAPLKSDAGAPTSVTLTLNVSSPSHVISDVVKSYGDGSAYPPVSPVMNYYTYHWWHATLTLTLKGLRPRMPYVLYGYGAGNATGQGSAWALASDSGGATGDVLADYGSGHTRDVTDPKNLGHSYVRLDGVASPQGTLTVKISHVPGNNDPYFNGFQLKEADQGRTAIRLPDTVTTEGDTASLSATTTDGVAYLWQYSRDNGVTFTSLDNRTASASTLKITHARKVDAGLYRVLVLNSKGVVAASFPASLTVISSTGSTPPPAYNVAFRDNSQGALPAVVGAAAAGTATSVWNNLVGAKASTSACVQTLLDAVPLVTDSGAASGAKVTLVATVTSYSLSAAIKAGSDAKAFSPVSPILQNFTCYWWPDNLVITVTGLRPNEGYTLYGYGSGASSGNGSNWTVGAASADVLADFDHGFTRDVSHAANEGHAYVKLRGQASAAGTLFFSIKSPGTGGDPYFNGFQLVPFPLPAITTPPPASAKASLSGSFSLKVTASGQGTLAYQWQKSSDNGASYENLDSALIPSARSANLTIAPVGKVDAGGYRVIVTNNSGSIVSGATTVTTTTERMAPFIVASPADTTVLSGEDAVLSVAASGTSPLTYQWQRSTDDGGTYQNVGTSIPTLAKTSAQLADTALYRVIVTNSLGRATSSPATLAVQQAPVITEQPSGGIFSAGTVRTLSEVVTAAPTPSYAWQFSTDGVSFKTIGTSPTCPVTLSPATSGIYRVVATNSVGTATSEPTFLGVNSTQGIDFFPANNAKGINPDAPLVIRFSAPPKVGAFGKITVYKADGTVVETIDTGAFQTLKTGATLYRYQVKDIGGAGGDKDYKYFPVVIVGNEARITLKSSATLGYGQTYYVTLDPGAILDSTGATLPAVSGDTAWRFTTKPAAPAPVSAQKNTFTVDIAGGSDFSTLQGAIDHIPAGNTTPVRILVKSGVYQELINYGGRNNITVVGQNRDRTIIRYLDNAPLNGGISTRVIYYAKGSDLVVENLTITNATPKGGGQAEALRSDGPRNSFLNCTITSFQDTLLLGAGNYFQNCLIQGDTDFIWGGGPALFKNCELRSMNGGDLCQARTSIDKFGFIFVDCILSRPAGSTFDYTLGRNSVGASDSGNAAFINCRMDTHITAAGWSSGFTDRAYPGHVRNWEYQSTDITGVHPLDVSHREISRQLTAQEAAILRNPANVFGATKDGSPAGAVGNGWVPAVPR